MPLLLLLFPASLARRARASTWTTSRKPRKRCSSRKHGVRVLSLSAPEGWPISLQHFSSLLTPERLCIAAYYRSAADDERSKSLRLLFPLFRADRLDSASLPGQTNHSLQLEPRRLLADPFPTPRPAQRPPGRPLDLDPRPPLEDANLHLAGRDGALGPPGGGEMPRTDCGVARDPIRGMCLCFRFAAAKEDGQSVLDADECRRLSDRFRPTRRSVSRTLLQKSRKTPSCSTKSVPRSVSFLTESVQFADSRWGCPAVREPRPLKERGHLAEGGARWLQGEATVRSWCPYTLEAHLAVLASRPSASRWMPPSRASVSATSARNSTTTPRQT